MIQANRSRVLFPLLLLLVAALLLACSSPAAPENEPAAVSEPAADSEPAALGEPIDNDGQVPFYARFGIGETFQDDEWTTIVFYRAPDCIPADFNLMDFFHFPGETGPGAMGCNPPTMDGTEVWEGEPGSGPAPKIATMTGNGAVPVWFVNSDELADAAAGGEINIAELAALPSLIKGTASSYDELLHPGQSNETPLIQFTAVGALEDGRSFKVEVDHMDGKRPTTIEIAE